MRYVHATVAVGLCFLTNGCHPFWNPAGAKGIAYDQFDTIYYQTNTNRTKAYLFFSQPKRLMVGMSDSTRWDREAEKIGVAFGGVTDTKSHRLRYGTALPNTVWTNGLWMMPFDIGVGRYGKPGDEFRMYYWSNDNPWGIEIPYKGTKGD
ncbi:MAG: hypothetical protein ACLQU3_14340 [Limisphaerales bacterium]